MPLGSLVSSALHLSSIAALRESVGRRSHLSHVAKESHHASLRPTATRLSLSFRQKFGHMIDYNWVDYRE